MWRFVGLLAVLACDEGEVICTPASEPAYCGGKLATGCTAVRGTEVVEQWVLWQDAKTGRTLDVWQCELSGCSDLLPYAVLCECAEAEGWADTGLGCG